MASLMFLGAAQTVTGSKYLFQFNHTRILIDCGLFQGEKELRLINWDPFTVDPKSIDAVILTHAHIDHSGYLPLLVRQGFNGPIYATEATYSLCKILLPDSGRLQKEEAEYANRKGFSKHHPALPLYTEKDALKSLTLFKPKALRTDFKVSNEVTAHFYRAGHILGAAILQIEWEKHSMVFSGDLGRYDDLIMDAPESPHSAQYLCVESTYGDRIHSTENVLTQLAHVINSTLDRNGVLLIPSFAVGRAQSLIYAIYLLKKHGQIPNVPVFLNSPLAIDATSVFCNHPHDHKLPTAEALNACSSVSYVRSVEESKELNKKNGPMIIIASSGMLTGGRVLHHLRQFGTNPNNTILFVGFQAPGTRGEALIHGKSTIRIFGEPINITAQITYLHALSAHADQSEILKWLAHFHPPPQMTFICHGQKHASEELQRVITDKLGWKSKIPALYTTWDFPA